jgi:hypothetical protein
MLLPQAGHNSDLCPALAFLFGHPYSRTKMPVLHTEAYFVRHPDSDACPVSGIYVRLFLSGFFAHAQCPSHNLWMYQPDPFIDRGDGFGLE